MIEFFIHPYLSSSSRDLTFLCVADIRRSNSHEVIARSYYDETLAKSMEQILEQRRELNDREKLTRQILSNFEIHYSLEQMPYVLVNIAAKMKFTGKLILSQ